MPDFRSFIRSRNTCPFNQRYGFRAIGIALQVIVLSALAACWGCGGKPGSATQAPTALAYSSNPAEYTLGFPIPQNNPSQRGGKVDSYTISPTLPSGLNLDASTGAISGIPIAITSRTDYTVTATNSFGSTTADLAITVNDALPRDLSYTYTIATFHTGIPIPSDSPSNNGGRVTSYTISPNLPAGLALDATTGVISGEPTAISGTTKYLVTASNSGGAETLWLTFTVVPPIPVITIQPVNASADVGGTATFRVAATGFGPLTYQWQRFYSDINGATAPSYTTPPLGLSDNGALITVIVSDAYGSSASSDAVVLNVPLGIFTFTASASRILEGNTATLLPDGRVLFTGGFTGDGVSASAEIYDPAVGLFTPTGSMTVGREFHTATLLKNGKVLIVGGLMKAGTTATAELFDPASGSFVPTGSLSTARESHIASLLPNGKVLVAGGELSGPLSTAELYDPDLGIFTSTGALVEAREGQTATVLSNGKVLLVGGWDGQKAMSTAELYDPSSGTFALTGSLAVGREEHTATLLQNGKVLITGGLAFGGSYSSIELFDPDTGTFSYTGNMILGRAGHTATLLLDGRVLIAGAATGPYGEYAAELYDPSANSFIGVGSILAPAPTSPTSTLLLNGKVLIAGGDGLAFAHLFDPQTPVPQLLPAAGGLVDRKLSH